MTPAEEVRPRFQRTRRRGRQNPWALAADDRQQHLDGAPDQLLARVPEQTLELSVHERDLAVCFHKNDGIRQRLDRERESVNLFEGFALRPPRTPRSYHGHSLTRAESSGPRRLRDSGLSPK